MPYFQSCERQAMFFPDCSQKKLRRINTSFNILWHFHKAPSRGSAYASLPGVNLGLPDQQVLVWFVLFLGHDLAEIPAAPVPSGLIGKSDPVVLQAEAGSISAHALGQDTGKAGFLRVDITLSRQTF